MKNEFREKKLPNFKIFYQTTVIKAMVWYKYRERLIDQWNRIRSRNKPSHVR